VVAAAIVAGVGTICFGTSLPAAHATSVAPVVPADQPPIVLLAVPGLLWSDVAAMPHLAALAAHSAVGELSVKTRGGVTRCAAGLLAVSAGNRTQAPVSTCHVNPSLWPDIAHTNSTSRYSARIGTLGSTLQAAGFSTVAVGPRAVPMLANTSGTVSKTVTSVRSALTPGTVAAVLDTRLYPADILARTSGEAAVDARVAQVEAALPPDATLIVAGVSDLGSGYAELHTFVLSGPGWTHTELRSSAAGRAPYVQLIDIAPTILAAEHVHIPSTVVGRPVQPSGTTPPGVAAYVDDNHHAMEQRTLGQRVFLILGITVIVTMVLAASPLRTAHAVARWVARLIAPAPAMIFLANGFPWWRWGQGSYAAILIGGCLVVASITAAAARWNRTAGLLVAPVFSFVVLGIDQFTGAQLQLSAPLGDSPLVAGRFSGMGNLDFAVMATSAMLVGGMLAGRLSRGRAVITAAVIAFAALVIDGAPQLGNDIGGVLALVPASLVLVAMVAQVKVTKLRIVAVVVTTVVVAVGLALIDYTRPATDQTHVGRFVGQVLHGGASTEFRRKMDAALASFGLTIGTFVVIFAVVLAVVCRKRIAASLGRLAGGAAAAVAATVVAVLGVVVNDSGITIAAMAAIVGVSALYGGGLGTWKGTREDEPAPSGTAAG
jgi:hypothetical protein